MPEEFEEVMQQDEIGSQLFHQLTAGKKRSLLYMIGKVKNVQSRINKSLAVMEHLKENQVKLDYKILNEKMEEFNRKI
ncbi:MAG: YdeI/OmpD-associated family protein [Flavobacteriales bacterium]